MVWFFVYFFLFFGECGVICFLKDTKQEAGEIETSSLARLMSDLSNKMQMFVNFFASVPCTLTELLCSGLSSAPLIYLKIHVT